MNQSNKVFVMITLTLLVGMLSACAGTYQSAPMETVKGEASSRPAADAGGRTFASYSTDNAASSSQTVERMVIKNASLSLVVDKPEEAMDIVSQLADEMGGFVVSARLSQRTLDSGAKVPQANITIRVTAENLDKALSRIKALSSQAPLSENLDSQDVTKEYTDLQSRLRNELNTETTLQKIMDQATKTEDVLAVYTQLTQVRQNIEVLKGQIQYYEQSVALSAISVELLPNEAVQPLTIGGWRPAGVAKDAIQTLINTLKFLGNLVIWIIIYALPVLVVLFVLFGLPFIGLRRLYRRIRPAKRQPVAPAVANTPVEKEILPDQKLEE